MKKHFTLMIFLLFFSTLCFSQTDYNDLYKASKWKNGNISLRLPAWTFKWTISDNEEELKKTLKGLKNVSFIVSENSNKRLSKALEGFVANPDYKDLMIIQDGNTSVHFRAKVSHKGIKELVMIMEDGDELVVVCMRGLFQKEDIGKLINIAQKQT